MDMSMDAHGTTSMNMNITPIIDNLGTVPLFCFVGVSGSPWPCCLSSRKNLLYTSSLDFYLCLGYCNLTYKIDPRRDRSLGMKRNIISVLTGISHERLQVLHQGAAFNFLYMPLVHTFSAIIDAYRYYGAGTIMGIVVMNKFEPPSSTRKGK
jgi:hypothetical protein